MTRVLRAVSAAAIVHILAAPVGAQTTFLFMHSQPGDYIGAGVTRTFTPGDGNFNASRNFDNGVSVTFNGGADWWQLDFAAPQEALLTPGAYDNATRFPFQSPTVPGLSVYGSGRGCNTLTGRFDVFEVVYGAGDAIVAFAANFEQHCEGAGPALFGSIRYQAAALPSHAVTVTRSGNGSVSSLPVGIACGATCTATFTNGTVVALLAQPASGHVFSGWSGDADCSDGVVSGAQTAACHASFVPCTVSLSPGEAAGSVNGGFGTVSVVTGQSCQWTATTTSSWFRLLSAGSGTGGATLSYQYDARGLFAQPRSATLTVNGQTFTLTQAGIQPTFSVTPGVVEASPRAGTSVVQVSSNAPDAIWTASAGASWLSVPASGAVGQVEIGLARNADTQSRSAAVTIAGITVPVTQRGNGLPGEPAELGAAVVSGQGRFTWLPPDTGGDATQYRLEAGLVPGAASFVFNSTGGTPEFQVSGVPPGRFYLRVRGLNEFGVGVPSEEYALIVEANGTNRPGRPRNVQATMTINRLSLTWQAPSPLGMLDGYVLEVGSVTGSRNIAVLPLGLTTSFTYDNVPPGFYFLRIRGVNAAGEGDASFEQLVVAGGVPAPPGAPVMQAPVVSGRTVNLSWMAGPGTPASQYRLEVGSQRGANDLAVFTTAIATTTLGFTSVPPGRYFVRVRGVNAQGVGPVSTDVRLDVP